MYIRNELTNEHRHVGIYGLMGCCVAMSEKRLHRRREASHERMHEPTTAMPRTQCMLLAVAFLADPPLREIRAHACIDYVGPWGAHRGCAVLLCCTGKKKKKKKLNKNTKQRFTETVTPVGLSSTAGGGVGTAWILVSAVGIVE